MRTLNTKFLLNICLLVTFVFLSPANANTLKSSIALKRSIGFPHYPVVLKGSDIRTITGVPVNRINLFSVKNNQLTPLVFQIDIKDENNRFVLVKTENTAVAIFDANDEIVFLAKDTGSQWQGDRLAQKGAYITEIELEDPISGDKKYVYAVSYHSSSSVKKNSTDNIYYNRETDTIWSDKYRIDFVKDIPFLVDTFNWAAPSSGGWHPNIIDSTKVRHTGTLFGLFDFERTHQDYTSRLVAIKDGPVRVIRRTTNSVYLLFGFSSPEILIDLIAYPNAVFMDTHVNLPFKLGLLFSDLKTYMTVDLDNNEALPKSYIFSESINQGAEINGTMNETKRQINQSGDIWLVLNSDYGSLLTGLIIDEGLPVTRYVYMMDDLTHADPPEDIKGWYGNIGYVTKRWEEVEGGIHHMLFGIYILDKTDPKKGFEILIDAPWTM